jgi:hypothetical protein
MTAPPDASDARKLRRKRAEKAWAIRDEWQAVLYDAYDFVAQHRLSTRLYKKTPGAFMLRMFDNTASVAWQKQTGKIQMDLFPPGEPWGMLEPGPAVEKSDNVDDFRKQLRAIDDMVDPIFFSGAFDAAIHETISDMLISTGALFIPKGDVNHPVHFVNVSFDEIALDAGPYNTIHGIFWKRKWARRALFEAFPNGKFTADFKAELETRGEELVEVSIDTIFDMAARKWTLSVYLMRETDDDIWTESRRSGYWLTPRQYRLPGQVYGFGSVLINMPITKTLNKAIELTLKGAAIAAMGIYTRVDDGVFNPDTARMEPAAFWAVARNGGPLGPSIAKLPVASDPNLANITIQDMRQMIQAGYNDQTLPPDGQSPRSAAEIIERVKRMGEDHAGFFGRLVHELALPLRRIVIEILFELGILKEHIEIDQLFAKLRIVSPMGSAYRARRAVNYLNFVQACNAAEPGAAHVVTPIDDGLRQVGHDLGVCGGGYKIYTAEESAAAQQKLAAAAAMAQQQGSPGAEPPPPNGDPMQGRA